LQNIEGAVTGISFSEFELAQKTEQAYTNVGTANVPEATQAPLLEQWVDVGNNTQEWTSTGDAVATQSGTSDALITGINNLTISTTDAVAWVQEMLLAGKELEIYNTAKEWGISANSLDAMMGWEAGTSNQWAMANELTPFANGGVVNQPTVALFGEAGTEAFVPLPDGKTIPVTMKSDSAVESRLEMLERIMIEVLKNGKDTYKLLQRVENNGLIALAE